MEKAIEIIIKKNYIQLVENKELNYNTDLTLLGFDSLTFVELIVLIEEELNVKVKDELLQIEYLNSISKICESIKSSQTE